MKDECFATHEPFEEIKMYNGEVTLLFDNDQHVYYEVVDGERLVVAGTTGVSGSMDKSPALMQWAANQTVELVMQTVPTQPEARVELLSAYALVKEKKPVPTPSRYAVAVGTAELAKLLNDARFNFRTLTKEASDIGHIAHAWLESKIRAWQAGDKQYLVALPEDEKARNCVTAALDWWNKHKFVPLHSEERVYSRTYGVAGTLDFIGMVTSCGEPACCPFDGVACELGDFKSSKELYLEYWLQLAAYLMCLREEFPDLVIDHRRLLKLGKHDGEFETKVRTSEHDEHDINAFLGLLQGYNWVQQNDIDAKQVRLDLKAAKEAAKALKPKPVSRPRLKKEANVPFIPTEGEELDTTATCVVQ